MMKFELALLLTSCAAIISGCGGSGGQTETVPELALSTPELAVSTLSDIDDLLNTESWTSEVETPTAGVAIYNGVIGALWNEGAGLDLGEAEFTANFNSGSVTMTSSNFEEYDVLVTIDTSSIVWELESANDVEFVQDLTGSLTMTNGVIGTDEWGDGNFIGTISGSLTGTSEHNITVDYSSQVEGFFVGDSAQAIIGGSISGSAMIFVATE